VHTSAKTRLVIAGTLFVSLVMTLPAGAALAKGKLSHFSPGLNSTVPADPTVAGMLPRGPQHMVVSFEGKNPTNLITGTAAGYINFTKGDQAGCSSSIVSTSSLSPGERVRQIRAANHPTYSAFIAGTKSERADTPLGKYYEMGVGSKAPSVGVFFLPAGQSELMGDTLGSGTGAGWCMLDELDRYASFVSGSSGGLRLNIAAVTLLSLDASTYALVNEINAADFPTEQSAITAYYLLSHLAEPSLATVYDSWHLSLTRHGSVVTLINNESRPGVVLKWTATFTPTALQTVPSVKGESLAKQWFGSASARTKFRNYNQSLG
jgi:hypothetical protein